MTNAACQTVDWCNHSKAKSVCTKTTQAKIAIRKMGMHDMPTDRTNQSGKEKNIYAKPSIHSSLKTRGFFLL